jgi:hypothetical protein
MEKCKQTYHHSLMCTRMGLLDWFRLKANFIWWFEEMINYLISDLQVCFAYRFHKLGLKFKLLHLKCTTITIDLLSMFIQWGRTRIRQLLNKSFMNKDRFSPSRRECKESNQFLFRNGVES